VPHPTPQVAVARSHASSAGQSVGAPHPHTPATHAVPFAFPAQLTQVAPQAVEDHAVHAPPTQQVLAPHVPSVPCPHAAEHVPATLHVGVAPVQPAHVPPLVPQAPFAEPAAHCPVSGLQQPPLHAVSFPAPQATPQVNVVVLHERSGPHSAAVVQPHCVLPLTHALPLPLPAQLTQAAPHAVALCVTHVLPWQQVPPPQVPSAPCPQAAVHVLPPEHVGVPFTQAEQAPPVLPQAPFAVPVAHCPEVGSQQPPLQAVSAAAPQAVTHTCVVVLHA
jgi:hypothetical protein